MSSTLAKPSQRKPPVTTDQAKEPAITPSAVAMWVFPVPIALAATWSASTVAAAQTVAAREARAAGVHWTFAPMIDVARDPRWGRIVEGAGEDPVLGAVMAAAQVRGFQGDLGRDRLLAGPKHFLGYGAARGGRDYDDVEGADSELWNGYLPRCACHRAAPARRCRWRR